MFVAITFLKINSYDLDTAMFNVNQGNDLTEHTHHYISFFSSLILLAVF